MRPDPTQRGRGTSASKGFPNDAVCSERRCRGSTGRWASRVSAVRLSHGAIMGRDGPESAARELHVMQSARPLRERALVLARLLVVTVAAVSTLPARAHAEDKNAAVLSFDGPRAVKMRDAVVSSVSEEINVVPSREVQSTADRLGVDLSSADGRIA